jgi:rfaE bifunctional protein nucleotidyltransferase chain/domain
VHLRRKLRDKIVGLQELKKHVISLKQEGKKIVFTNGCFDVIHAGHVNLLQDAGNQGDILIVALNSDSSVQTIKGSDRPIISQNHRAEVLASLESVDYVVMFDEPDPLRVIQEIEPNVLVKGGDWSTDAIVGRDVVERTGGTVMSIPLIEGISTTEIIRRIKDADEE